MRAYILLARYEEDALRQGFTEAQALVLTLEPFVSTAPRYWNLQPEATTPSALLKVGKVTWTFFSL